MGRLRVTRAVFVLGLPFVVVLHVAISREEVAWLRGAGLLVIVVWLLLHLWLAYARCPSCRRSFFGSFAGQVWGAHRAFRLRPACASCEAALHGRALY